MSSTRLDELARQLDAQLPILFSFIILRSILCACGICIVRKLLRFRAVAIAVAIFDIVERMRNIGLVAITLLILFFTSSAPPTSVCAHYSATRVQGACAFLALAVLITTNRVLSSGIAISALKAVSVFSTAALPLSLSCVVATTNPYFTLFYFLSVGSGMLGYSVMCHDENETSKTHGAVLYVLFIGFFYSSAVCVSISIRVFLGYTRLCKALFPSRFLYVLLYPLLKLRTHGRNSRS